MATAEDLRRAALAQSEALEIDHFGRPSYRVHGKIFAQESDQPGRAILKLPMERQTLLFEVRPDVFSPCVWGQLVWAYVLLKDLEIEELVELTTSAWTTVAPRSPAAKRR